MDGEKEQYALNLIKSYASTQTFLKNMLLNYVF